MSPQPRIDRPAPPKGADLERILQELQQELVPAEHAEILFNRDPNGGVRDVLVLNKKARLEHGILFDQLSRDKDLGASISGWSDCPTPEAVWRGLMLYGFASPAEGLRAMVQFARIRECTWARRMVFEDDVCALFSASTEDRMERVHRVQERRAAIDSGEDLDFVEAERELIKLAWV